MKVIRYYLLLSLVFIFGAISYAQKDLNALMRERGEYYFTLSVDDPSEIQTISDICSVDGTDGETVVCYANQQEYDKLLQAGYQPNLQTPPSMRANVTMWDGNGTYNWNTYLTYNQYVTMMQGFPSAAVSGRTCTLLDLGALSTSNHRHILGVRLNNGQPDGKPKFLYTSTMHGDEVTGMILMLRLIDEFCTSTDPRIVNILNNVDLFIFPCTNPDGTYYGGNNTVNGARRRNGNNIDLNRHFPDFDDGAHPDGQSYYQDEAQWMMDLAQQYLFTMGANYHGGAEVMNYPWDTYQPLHPDDAWWQLICHEYADLTHEINASYMDDYNNGITNGYAWYTITGSRQDYMNYYGQCREVTIECSSTKTPNASTLPNYWNYNYNSMLTLIEECLNGVHGFVYDAVTNEPIQGVTVAVQNHDAFGSSVSTHAIGDFHRPIKGGTYTLVFSKSGYCPQSVEVTVADGQRVDLDTIFMESGCPEPDIINMQNGSVETCDALFYDSGGPEGNYGNRLTYTMTFYPSSEGAMTSVSFSDFELESNYDYLYIYDGTSTSATQIGQYTGTTSPGTVTATNEAGALTFKFTSDYSVNKSGWAATVSCEYPDVEQTYELSAGWNWWSTNLDITLDQLKAALVAALPGTSSIIIKSQTQSISYNGSSWRGSLNAIDIAQMYMIQVSASCAITLTGIQANSNEHPVTIVANGNTWIGFPLDENMSLSEVFGSFPVENDIIKSQQGNAIYNGSSWRGAFQNLELGKGYIYKSASQEIRTFTFGTSNNRK
jgi:hypothetical protein